MLLLFKIKTSQNGKTFLHDCRKGKRRISAVRKKPKPSENAKFSRREIAVLSHFVATKRR